MAVDWLVLVGKSNLYWTLYKIVFWASVLSSQDSLPLATRSPICPVLFESSPSVAKVGAPTQKHCGDTQDVGLARLRRDWLGLGVPRLTGFRRWRLSFLLQEVFLLRDA